jgi:hypothetical protein
MFLLILMVLLCVCVDFGGPPKSTQTYKRTTQINKNIQKNHQNQHKHTKDQPKVLLYVSVDFGVSFVCFC